MIYFIITTSIFNDCTIRKGQYIIGISKLNHIIKKLNIQNYKIIIVENNGLRYTYLNNLGYEINYTNNNSLKKDKGYKELQDILDCIDKYNINDNDFIVKMTGRYILNDDSEFMKIVKNIHNINYDCVIKYGSYNKPVNYKMDDCITGLIGMTCYYIKQIEKDNENECIERKWARVTNLIDNKKIHLVNNLGIYISPLSNRYFMV
jgi:L-rhamnose mutarotase